MWFIPVFSFTTTHCVNIIFTKNSLYSLHLSGDSLVSHHSGRDTPTHPHTPMQEDPPPCSRHTHAHQCRRTHRHVAGTAGIPRVGQRVHQTTTDTKVAQLDVAVAIQENVGGLHVWRAQRERDGGYWEEQEWETWQVQLLLLNKIFMNYRLITNFFMAPCTLADRICHEYYALV